VHRAESTDGRALAVKVLRPGVDAALMRDLALMGALAGRLALLRPEWRGLRIEDSIDGFAEVLETGIDLRLEAAAAMKIADNFVGDETFRLAETDWERSARRVLTRAYVTGPGIDERDAIMAAGFDPAQVLVNLITAFFKQVLRDGAFVTEFSGETLRMAQDGAIVATDLGAVVRLTPGARRYLGALLAGLVERDFEGAARALQEAGWVPPHREPVSTARALERIADTADGEKRSFSDLVVPVFHAAELAILEGHPRLIAFESALLGIERIAAAIAPQTPLWDTALPVIRSCLADVPARRGRRIARPRPVASELAVGRLPGESPARPPADALRLYPKVIRRLRFDTGINPYLPMTWIVFVAFFVFLALIL
jgi:ubiquinone biosynthesis protein